MTDELTKQQRREITRQIAEALNETEETPIKIIARMLYFLGEARTRSFLQEALQQEANGGMLTADGQQRRTVGGLFFKLVKSSITSRERGRIFGPAAQPSPQEQKPKNQPPVWQVIQPLAEELLSQPHSGRASKVKLTLIGRPGQIIEKGTTVLATMQSRSRPTLPKGLPSPPEEPTTYLVFIALNQWQNVKQVLADDSADKLVIEGYPIFDKRLGQNGAMTLYAQSVSTQALRRAKWGATKSA